jgi:hypothetical protein
MAAFAAVFGVDRCIYAGCITEDFASIANAFTVDT